MCYLFSTLLDRRHLVWHGMEERGGGDLGLAGVEAVGEVAAVVMQV